MIFVRPRQLWTILIAVLCLSFGSSLCTAAELVLAEKGQPTLPIIISDDPAPLTPQMAQELADYLEKITGVRPLVIQGTPSPLPAHAIWLGDHAQLASAFPDVDLQLNYPEEIQLAANGNHLLIRGRDRWIPGHTNLQKTDFSYGTDDVKNFQQEYGSANAMYTFLHDHLGVRVLWPGEEVVPRQARIALKPFTSRYHPQIRQRQSIIWQLSRFRAGGKDGTPGAHWARFNHMQLDSLDVRVQGHAFGDWWQRFHESHPEYFALQPDGTRSGFPGGKDGQWAKICVSNPKVWDQWIEDVRTTLQENPNRTSFTSAANDGWGAGHCVCENCRAWDHPEGKARSIRWQGVSGPYVALSNRELRLANILGQMLKEHFPDKQLTVSTHAYGLTRPAPIDLKPADNVIISSVSNFFLRPDLVDTASQDNELHVDQYKAWAKITDNIFWRPNTGNPADWRVGGYASLNQIIDHFQLLKDTGCIGISIDTVWGYWGTQGPAYYLMSRLAWDIQCDPHAILDDYYTKGFGPAAADVKAYWALVEETREHLMANDLPWEKAFTPAFFTQAHAHLKAGAEKLSANETDYRRRLDFVADGLTYQELRTDSLNIVNRIKASKAKAVPADITALEQNWVKIETLARKQPQLLNTGQVLRNPTRGNLKAIHPDNYK